MNYAAIKPTDVANGPGVRVSLFVSGCTHYCPECFNAEAWDFDYGQVFTNDTIHEILAYLDHPYIAGLSLLGGEPFHPRNQGEVLKLAKTVREHFPEKTIWCYTGYDFEKEILGQMADQYKETMELLSCLDILVDGRFQLAKKDLKLRFRGSANQRIIRVPESLREGKVLLWEEG
ncbi:MAG TPA: anaerobic ribonucleoside-triphosphate reductase activating protein [Candidatus Hungatella pullicola]|nr:anaerobic ribonucleoside-triphosphate reductase activating protein [Candidatus Hungatella pullicola]